jgi:hypothetical protein
MTDRELLELAARAAGIKIEWGEVFNIGDCEVDCTDLAFADDSSPDDAAPSVWSPLTDDGDALRLAVRLGIQVFGREIGGCANDIFVDEADCGGDCYAATRRAIVRAAAEIGRNMP